MHSEHCTWCALISEYQEENWKKKHFIRNIYIVLQEIGPLEYTLLVLLDTYVPWKLPLTALKGSRQKWFILCPTNFRPLWKIFKIHEKKTESITFVYGIFIKG